VVVAGYDVSVSGDRRHSVARRAGELWIALHWIALDWTALQEWTTQQGS